MAKKRDPKLDTAGGAGLGHHPFAALAGLAAPPGPAAAEPPAEAPSPADGPRFPNKLVVRREKKGRGGKTVTRIRGIPAAEREAIAARLKKALGCGAAVEGEDLVLLGALVDRAADWLEAEGARRVARSA